MCAYACVLVQDSDDSDSIAFVEFFKFVQKASRAPPGASGGKSPRAARAALVPSPARGEGKPRPPGPGAGPARRGALDGKLEQPRSGGRAQEVEVQNRLIDDAGAACRGDELVGSVSRVG